MDTAVSENSEQTDKEILQFGNSSNFWRFSFENGFDLTRSSHEGDFIRFETTTKPITVDPARSAIIIVDMQNFFVHPTIQSHEPGLAASKQLFDYVLPAARKTHMQVIWLNWGLTQDDIDQAPPSMKAAFSSGKLDRSQSTSSRNICYKGFGEPLGEIELPDGRCVEGGGLLMRNAWNASLYDPLLESYQNSQSSSKPDQLFHKVLFYSSLKILFN